jgi:amidase
MDMNAITALDAGALSSAIHERRVSCREVMRACLDRIAAVNSRHNAIVSLREEGALLREADERDAQLARGESLGWMHGMPQAVKDLVNVAGITLGSPLMRNFMPQADALMCSA